MRCLRNLPLVLMQVPVKYCENGPTTPATCKKVDLKAALLMYASNLFWNNGWRKFGNIPRHDPREGDISVEDEVAVFFVRSKTSGEGDSAAIDLLVGALEELGSIMGFFTKNNLIGIWVLPICFYCIKQKRVTSPSLCFILNFRAMAWTFHSKFCLCDSLILCLLHRLIVYIRPLRPGTTTPQTLQSYNPFLLFGPEKWSSFYGSVLHDCHVLSVITDGGPEFFQSWS